MHCPVREGVGRCCPSRIKGTRPKLERVDQDSERPVTLQRPRAALHNQNAHGTRQRLGGVNNSGLTYPCFAFDQHHPGAAAPGALESRSPNGQLALTADQRTGGL